MWVIKINNVEASHHTQKCDAIAQKQCFIDNGAEGSTIVVEEQPDSTQIDK